MQNAQIICLLTTALEPWTTENVDTDGNVQIGREKVRKILESATVITIGHLIGNAFRKVQE